MNGEQNSAKNPGRRISMELTADAARVTSLSLSGNRLVVTIEAELADSQMHAVEAAAASPSPDSGAALSNQMLYSRPGYPTPNDTQPILGMDVVASPIDETETDTLNVDSFPPMEPVRELTDTWDTPASNAQAAQGGSGQHPWSAVPAPEPVPAPVPAPTPVALAEPEKDEQDHLETRDDEILYGNESARKCAEPAPPPAVPPAPAPVPAPAPI
ncbi:MAG: hypothetical protein LBS30_02635, partial [Planctomycetota bacterium]|nr:hypothetical protein [Planctomycetota bacterium]